jgi:hypothetical protein
MDEGEDGGVGSDAEGEREDGDDGEAGASQELARAVADVVGDAFGGGLPSGGTDFLFYRFDAAHLGAGGALGFVRAEAAPSFFFG